MEAADQTRPIELRQLHLLEDCEPHSAALNMAIDEVLLGMITTPTLRIYRWRKPSLSFGYFGRFDDVAHEADRREVVRRWTGGGMVLHGADLTYSFLLPQKEIAAAASARAVYVFVHRAIGQALQSIARVELAARDAPKISDACFANPVVADVLIADRKIAGAAQRRTRAGLLHQGSIQYEQLPPLFVADFATALCPTYRQVDVTPSPAAETLAAQKYATPEWLHRR
ncbi:MAG: lipoate--protein ligase family protein [Chthoniobacterales bacterium]